MNLQNKKFLVVGTGRSGIAAANLLVDNQMHITIYDSNERLKGTDVWNQSKKLEQVPIVIGKFPELLMEETDICIMSPGVPTDLPFVEAMRANGILIWGEIELAYRLGQGRLIGITGSNGKTTTTSLVGEIMKRYYKEVQVVGNIGIAYTKVVEALTADSVIVAEISSFQLETIDEFHPNVSAILNLQPDHLDRHHTMDNYIKTKENIAKNQSVNDSCILNYDYEELRRFAKGCKAKIVFFSSVTELDEGLFYKDQWIYLAHNGQTTRLIKSDEIHLVGICNMENVMASIAISMQLDVPMEMILEGVRAFKAVEHRIEFVATKRGVDYYNDSKATNPDAAIQGILAMNKPTLLIGGGYDKGSDYRPWIKACEGKVKRLVLLGVTADAIMDVAKDYDLGVVEKVETFKEAMAVCISEANEGDAVLLSPACASWGMFPNYEERGKLFKTIVHEIEDN